MCQGEKGSVLGVVVVVQSLRRLWYGGAYLQGTQSQTEVRPGSKV